VGSQIYLIILPIIPEHVYMGSPKPGGRIRGKQIPRTGIRPAISRHAAHDAATRRSMRARAPAEPTEPPHPLPTQQRWPVSLDCAHQWRQRLRVSLSSQVRVAQVFQGGDDTKRAALRSLAQPQPSQTGYDPHFLYAYRTLTLDWSVSHLGDFDKKRDSESRGAVQAFPRVRPSLT